MKAIINAFYLFVAAMLCIFSMSCNKNVSAGTSSGSIATSASASAVITVAASISSSDSVNVLQQCDKGQYRDSVNAADLPTGIIAYLDTAYNGYVFNKAFAVKDSSGTIHNYIVIIYFNNKPIGLLFDENGAFERVLEQREPGNMHGEGWHHEGRFNNRDGEHKDTVALTDLPTAITTYIATNYAGDTLVKAFKCADSGYVVITANNGLFANLFTSDGGFVKRMALPQPPGKPQAIAEDSLPAAITAYLTATYPGYVFNKAFLVEKSSIVKGYIVLIDANNTRYAVAFDANGNYISAMPVW